LWHEGWHRCTQKDHCAPKLLLNLRQDIEFWPFRVFNNHLRLDVLRGLIHHHPPERLLDGCPRANGRKGQLINWRGCKCNFNSRRQLLLTVIVGGGSEYAIPASQASKADFRFSAFMRVSSDYEPSNSVSIIPKSMGTNHPCRRSILERIIMTLLPQLPSPLVEDPRDG
jgi:hypothetical protein